MSRSLFILGDSIIMNPSAKQKTPIPSLSGEDPWEKEMATHSSVLAWEIPWTKEPGRLQSMESKEYNTT